MLPVIHESTLVAPAVWVGHGSCAIHLIGDPGALVDTTVSPGVPAEALNVVLVEVALVFGTVAP